MPVTTVAASLVAVLIGVLNVFLIVVFTRQLLEAL